MPGYITACVAFLALRNYNAHKCCKWSLGFSNISAQISYSQIWICFYDCGVLNMTLNRPISQKSQLKRNHSRSLTQLVVSQKQEYELDFDTKLKLKLCSF